MSEAISKRLQMFKMSKNIHKLSNFYFSHIWEWILKSSCVLFDRPKLLVEHEYFSVVIHVVVRHVLVGLNDSHVFIRKVKSYFYQVCVIQKLIKSNWATEVKRIADHSGAARREISAAQNIKMKKVISDNPALIDGRWSHEFRLNYSFFSCKNTHISFLGDKKPQL